jgi:hypothetical protein
MELILKLTENKLPYVGICFESQYEASRLNQQWVNKYPDHRYTLKLNPGKETIDLELSCNEIACKIKYECVKYTPERLLKFYHITRLYQLFNFGHVREDRGKHIPVKTLTNQKMFVLQIHRFTLDDVFF